VRADDESRVGGANWGCAGGPGKAEIGDYVLRSREGNRVGTLRLSRQLDPIDYYCKRNKLPPLSIIVVEKDTGRPSQGSFDEYSPSQAQAKLEAVWNRDWSKDATPSVNALAAALPEPD